MKRLFKGHYKGVFDYLLHLGPMTAFWLINFISATLVALAMVFVVWWTKR